MSMKSMKEYQICHCYTFILYTLCRLHEMTMHLKQTPWQENDEIQKCVSRDKCNPYTLYRSSSGNRAAYWTWWRVRISIQLMHVFSDGKFVRAVSWNYGMYQSTPIRVRYIVRNVNAMSSQFSNVFMSRYYHNNYWIFLSLIKQTKYEDNAFVSRMYDNFQLNYN